MKNIFLGLILSGTVVFAHTLVVGTCQSGTQYTTIQSAIDDASDGSTIEICAGTYNENINVNKNNLTIKGVDGQAIDDVVLNGGNDRAISINNRNETFDNFKITTDSIGIFGTSSNNGNNIFTNLDIVSGQDGIDISNGSKQTFQNLTITSQNDMGIQLSTSTTGDHTFNNITVNSKNEAIYVGKGGKSFTNLNLTSSTAAGLLVNSVNTALTFDTITINAPGGEGIHLGANTIGDHTFKNITVNSKNEALYVGKGGKSFTNLNLTSTNLSGNQAALHIANTSADLTFSGISVNSNQIGMLLGTAVTGKKDFKNINISSVNEGIYITSGKKATFDTLKVNSTDSKGIFLNTGNSGDSTFNNITVHSKDEAILAANGFSSLNDANLTSSSGNGVYLSPTQDITISNVKIKSDNYGIFSGNGSKVDITIKYSYIDTDKKNYGIYIGNADKLTVDSVCISNVTYGIYTDSQINSADISNSKIDNTTNYALHLATQNPSAVHNNCLSGAKLAYTNSNNNNFDGNYWDGVNIGSDGKITSSDSSKIDAHVVDNSPKSSCGASGCSEPIPDTNTNLCYAKPYEEGLSFGGFSMFHGVTTPIKNVSDTSLTDVIITKTFDGIDMSMNSEIAIDGSEKSRAKDGDGAHISSDISGSFGEFNGNLFNKGIVYTINNFSQDENHTIYDSSMASFDLSKTKIGAIYTKGGKRYYAVLHSCSVRDSHNINNIINPVCGTFKNVLQTRNNPSDIHHASNASADIYNNTGCTLNTGNVDFGSYQHLRCSGGGDTTASGAYGNHLNINYNFSVKSSTTASTSSSESDKKVTSANENLTSANYNKITQDWNKYSFSLNANNAKTINNLYQILNTVQINNLSNQNLNIGNFSTGRYSSTSLILNGIPNNIYINTLQNNGSNDLTISHFEATQSIEIGKLDLRSSKTLNLTIKAPKITINNLHSTNDNNNITLYADEININSIIFAQHSKLIIHPYTPGKNIKFYSDSITASSSSTMILDSGNYYTNSFDIPGSSNVSSVKASDSNQIIHFFINGDFKPGNSPGINSDGNRGNFGSLPPANFLFLVNGDLRTGGGGTTFNAIVYVEGSTTFGSPSYLQGAISSNESIKIGDRSKFYYVRNINDAGWGECSNGSSSYITGPFDAWDISIEDTTPPQLSNRNISTKIVNKAFQLSLASLNKNNDAYELKKGIGPVDVAIYPKGSASAISNHLSFNASDKDYIHSSNNINVSSAQKEAVVGFKLCATYEKNTTTKKTSYILFSNASCSSSTVLNDCNASTSGTPTWHVCYSSDSFAIRPNTFTITSIPTQIKAGRDFNVTIKALDNDGKSAKDYNETLTIQGDSPRLDYNDTKISDGCINGNLTGENLTFKNGEANVTLKYSEVGDLNLTLQEINGSEFAKINENDTSDAQRFIPQYSKTITIIPDHFQINALYHAMNNDFTYISNDLNMSSILDINITANSFDDTITTNYNSICYAKNTNYNISYTNPTIHPSSALTRILYRETNTSTNGNKNLGSGINLTNIPKSLFSTDNNGTGSIHVKINFDRNITKAANPFILNIQEINVTDVNNTNGYKTLDQNVTFLYSRAHAQRQRYSASEGDALIYYEVYCNSGDKSLLPDGQNSKYNDDPRWFTNTHHQVATDGKIVNINQRGFSVGNGHVSSTINTSTPTTAHLTYDEQRGYPYKTTMEINASNWLIYNKYNQNATENEFQVEFINSSQQWAGKHETNSSTKRTAAEKTNRRLMW